MTAQSKRRWSIVSIYATAAALVGMLGYVALAQDMAYNVAMRPAVERTIGPMIHDSIAGCKARMDSLAARQYKSDSIDAVMGDRMIKVITLLEVMATNDELVKYKNRISNPTGIR